MDIKVNKSNKKVEPDYCTEGDLVIFRDEEENVYTCLVCRIDRENMRLIDLEDGDIFMSKNLYKMTKEGLIKILSNELCTDIEIHNSNDVSVEINIK